MNEAKLEQILKCHKKWINKNGGERADLRSADLSNADLRGADLREADLSNADLRGVVLSCAYLYGSNLRGADLREADLINADLRCAYLYGSNLREADLREADLRGADLREADLRWADLRWADLRGAGIVAKYGQYEVLAWPGGARVGCKCGNREYWETLTEGEADEIDEGGGEWLRKWRPALLVMIDVITDEQSRWKKRKSGSGKAGAVEEIE